MLVSLLVLLRRALCVGRAERQDERESHSENLGVDVTNMGAALVKFYRVTDTMYSEQADEEC